MDEIGNVNHTQHVKKNVTFHHNAGRLSLQGILDVWRTRPASAHFQVDGYAALGQYVRVNEYAWAQGVTVANEDSISIEMANLTLSPDWEVAEVTWREAARLCGWLHAKVIGVYPTRTTCKVHKDWKATVCAGPHIDTVLTAMIADAQTSYDYFTEAVYEPPPPPPPPPDPEPPPPPPPDPVYEVGYVPPEPDPALPPPWVPPVPDIYVPVAGLSVEQVALDILEGKWGPRATLPTLVRDLGYDYTAVRREILEILHATGELRMVKRPMHV